MSEPGTVQPLVQTQSLSKIYTTAASRVTVFEDLNWQIARGRLVAVIGPSGAGKSTLLHMLGGLDLPSSGTVLFEGINIFEKGSASLAEFRNRQVGFVFQFHHLLPEFTVLENTMMPGIIRGAPAGEMQETSRAMLERVGLGQRLSHKVGEISGGERQRVAIARALVSRPQLLLADEPTGNLDRKTGEAVFAMIRQLHAEQQVTSVIVTHNEKLASQCDEVWEMDGGKLQNPNCSG